MTDCTLCDETISQGRRNLGYMTCLGCGEAAANELAVKNENDATVYHVQDGGCLQEFWTLEEAKEYIAWARSYEC